MNNESKNFTHGDGVDLKDLFNSRIDNIHTLIDANDKNYNQRFDNVTSATQSALAASDRAVQKAETASEKRFDAVNEFRATLADQQRNLIPRNEVDILVKSLNVRIDSNIKTIEDLRLAISNLQAKGIGISQGWGYAIAIISVIVMILTILSRFLKY